MDNERTHDRIGRDDGTGNGPLVRLPADQLDGMRAAIAANRRRCGLPPQDDTEETDRDR